MKKSNDILQRAISTYIQTMNAPDVPDALFRAAGERCVQRMHFIGKSVTSTSTYFNYQFVQGRYAQAVNVHQMLISRFPDVVKFRNQLAVTYLTTNT